MPLYFAFGSNLDAARMRRRCPDAVAIGTAELPRHRLAFVGHSRSWRGGVATVIRDREGTVRGRLYDVTLADLAKLDRLEGCRYERVRRLVALPDGHKRRPWAYIHSDPTDASPPSRSYLRTIGDAYRRLGFDAAPLMVAIDTAVNERVDKKLVFVYGTLLSGEPNHEVLADAEYLGRGATEPVFDMVSLGAFPAIVSGGRTSITGEVYRVNQGTLAALDRLEGHPHFYRRAHVRLTTGESVTAYLLPRRRAQGRTHVAGGSWRDWRIAQ